MTNAALVQLVIRALRAAADELERGASEQRPRKPPVIQETVEISELDRARAQRALDRLGMG